MYIFPLYFSDPTHPKALMHKTRVTKKLITPHQMVSGNKDSVTANCQERVQKWLLSQDNTREGNKNTPVKTTKPDGNIQSSLNNANERHVRTNTGMV